MPIVKKKPLTVSDMRMGEYFLLHDIVYVRAVGQVRGKDGTTEVPVVVIIDPRQHEGEGKERSFSHPGEMRWLGPTVNVSPVHLIVLPAFEER
jgi:hypothetical protein